MIEYFEILFSNEAEIERALAVRMYYFNKKKQDETR